MLNMRRPGLNKHNMKYISSASACLLFYLSLVLVLTLGSFCLISSVDVFKVDPQLNIDVPKGQELRMHKSTISRAMDAGASMDRQLKSAAREYCDGRRIYMYDLPEEFNVGILQQCHFQIVSWLNFCPHIINHGFGRPFNHTSMKDWGDWYETDPYMLEVIFHSRMAYYPCATRVPGEADAFFIPYYSGLDALHYLYGERKRKWGEHGLKLVRWLQENEGGDHWRRRGGHDHFVIMGRTAWDFTRTPRSQLSASVVQGDQNILGDGDEKDGWGTSFASLPQMENVTALFVERRPWQSLEQAVPYPTAFHPTSLQILHAWQRKVQSANRTFLMAFVGSPRPLESCSSELHRTIRQAAIDQCAGNTTACSLLDCNTLKCAHAPVRIAEQLLDAHFCLQPPGDTATRRSTFDGLLSGCIPVFFMNDSAYNQYTWHLSDLHPSSYSVFVPRHQLNHVLPLLSSFSLEHIARMRRFIVEHLITRIIYASPQLVASHPSLHDAFQLTLDNMLRRVATSGAQDMT